MRCLERNKRPFYHAAYLDRSELEDDEGNKTGEYRLLYAHPIADSANISPATGHISVQQFGESTGYDKVIVMDNPHVPIGEQSILWIDTTPVFNANGGTLTPHDYIVKKVASGLNSVSIAVKKVCAGG